MNCPKCGTPIPPGELSCHHCGCIVDDDSVGGRNGIAAPVAWIAVGLAACIIGYIFGGVSLVLRVLVLYGLVFLVVRLYKSSKRKHEESNRLAKEEQERIAAEQYAEQQRALSMWRDKQTRLSMIDAMTGQEFEQYVAKKIEASGYKTELTPASNDYGVDIVATNTKGVRCAIQCKRYTDSVGVKAVQEVYAGAGHYGCDEKTVVTSSYFTPNAVKLAQELGVRLIDRESL